MISQVQNKDADLSGKRQECCETQLSYYLGEKLKQEKTGSGI